MNEIFQEDEDNQDDVVKYNWTASLNYLNSLQDINLLREEYSE